MAKGFFIRAKFCTNLVTLLYVGMKNIYQSFDIFALVWVGHFETRNSVEEDHMR